MKTSSFFLALGGSAAFAVASVLFARAPSATPIPQAAPTKSVTVFPIVIASDAPRIIRQRITEVVGLLLERAGVTDVEIAEAEFTPPAGADPPKVAEAFGQFVRERKIDAQYAVFGQFAGSPKTGVDEICLVVVDRQGKAVLAERADRDQLARAGGPEVKEPLTACIWLVNRLRGPLGLADPLRKDVPEGRMAQLWAKNSGTPSKGEQEAMDSRLKSLKRDIRTRTVAVCVTCNGRESDAAAAARLADMLKQEGFAKAEAAGADPKLEIKGDPNEQKILWDTARAFREFLRKNPAAADYAVLADYGIGRSPDGESHVGSVHLILCDHKGDWVLVDYQNSHHAGFQRVNPRTVEDCDRLAVERLKSRLDQ